MSIDQSSNPSFPHADFYQAKSQGNIEYKQEFSSSIDIQRLINGQPPYMHHTGESGRISKILVLNDWRYFFAEQNVIGQQIYEALLELVSREVLPFRVFFPSHEKFTEFTINTSFPDFFEPLGVLKNYEELSVHDNKMLISVFKKFYNHQYSQKKINEDNIYIVDCFEMDALINKTSKVEYHISIRDLMNANLIISRGFSYVPEWRNQKIQQWIAERAEKYTLNITIKFHGSEKDDKFYSLSLDTINCMFKEGYERSLYTKYLRYISSLKLENKKIEIIQSKQLTCYVLPESFKKEILCYITEAKINPQAITNMVVEKIGLSNQSFNDFQSEMPNIKYLDITFNDKLEPTLNENTIYTFWEKLTSFSAHKCNIKQLKEMTGFVDNACMNLKYLHLECDANDYTAQDITSNEIIAKSKPSLKWLSLNGCQIPESELFNMLMLLPNLESLDLPQINHDGKLKESQVLPLAHLTSIYIGSVFIEEIVSPLVICKILWQSTQRLKYIHIDSCNACEYQEIDSLNSVDLLFLTSLNKKYLSELQVCSAKIPPEFISDILSSSPNLYHLNLHAHYKCSQNSQSMKKKNALLHNNQVKYFNYHAGDCIDTLMIGLSLSPELEVINLGEWQFSLSESSKKFFTDKLKNLKKLKKVFGPEVIYKDEILESLADDNFVDLLKYEDGTDDENQSYVDAVYEEDDTEFNLKQVFFSPSGNHPDCSQYRLKIYNQLQLSQNVCRQEKAFLLSNKDDDLDLVEVDDIIKTSNVNQQLSQDDGNHQHYVGCMFYRTNDNWQAIPSLSANEAILSYQVPEGIEIDIQYSKRDNFYYLKVLSSDNRSGFKLTFSLRVHWAKEIFVSVIYNNALISRVVNSLRQFSNLPLTLNDNNCYTGTDYLSEILTQRKGACRHRAIAFKYLIDIQNSSNMPGETISSRVVVNDCHAYGELVFSTCEGSYIARFDLGGAPATINLDNSQDPFTFNILEEEKNASIYLKSLEDIAEAQDENTLTEDEIKDIENVYTEKLEKSQLDTEKKEEIERHIDSKMLHQTFSQDEFFQNLALFNPKKTLLTTTSKQHSFDTLFMIEFHFMEEQISYFVIHHPEDLLTLDLYIQSSPQDDSGKIVNERGGDLFDFINQAHNSQKEHFIILMYDSFKAKDIVKFNRIIDDNNRSADALELPDNIKILGVYNTDDISAYCGTDFYSRFTACYPIDKNITITTMQNSPLMSSNLNDIKKMDIHFYNEPYWRESLLGRWQMQGASLLFEKSAFVKALLNKQVNKFVFHNAPDCLELRYFLDKARVQGFFICNKKRIPFPNDLIIEYQSGYEFSILNDTLNTSWVPNIDPDTMHLVNKDTVDEFLGGYSLLPNSTRIQFYDGLIVNKRGQTLTLFVNDALSEDNLFQLITKAIDNDVKIILAYANHSVLPEKIIYGTASYQYMTNKNFDNNGILTERLLLSNESVEPASKRQKNHLQQCSILSSIILVEGDDVDVSQYLFIEKYMSSVKDNLIIIDVSETKPEQLLEKTHASFNSNTSEFEFSTSLGLLKKSENENRNIILKGTFKQSLINILSKYFLNLLKVNASDEGRKIVLIPNNINDFRFLPKKILQSFTLNSFQLITLKKKIIGSEFNITVACEDQKDFDTFSLSQLRAKFYYQSLSDANIELSPWQGTVNLEHGEYNNYVIDFDRAKYITEAFYHSRLSGVKKILNIDAENPIQQSCFVFLTGLTGIGKSHFIKNIWQKYYPSCFYGLDALIDFCQCEDNGIKTLFIDEANLLKTNFSLFEGLFEQKPHLFIDNEVYYLTSSHKVILAGNPINYSTDRDIFSLCQRHGNCFAFNELPPEVIYFEILKPLFNSFNIADEQSIHLSTIFLKHQNFINHLTNKITISPRELITMACLTALCLSDDLDVKLFASHISHRVVKNILTKEQYQAFSSEFPVSDANFLSHASSEVKMEIDKNFLMTPSRLYLECGLKDLISLHAHRQSTHTEIQSSTQNNSLLYDGLNGILIEGEPGVGKSMIVFNVLKELGYRVIGDSQFFEPTQGYYHIEASNTLEMKQQQLLYAFEHGYIVVMDEVNTALLDERFLNAILSGINPYTHERPKTPGFLLIATQNPSTMAGRKSYSEALQRRFWHFILPYYSKEEMLSILEYKGLDVLTSQYLIDYYLQKRLLCLSESLKSLCFRDLLSVADRLLETKQQNHTQAENVSQFGLFATFSDDRRNHKEVSYSHKSEAPTTSR